MSDIDVATTSRWHPAAAVAAWALPGLGHYLLGQRRRGVILAVTIGSLWLLGLLIGGVGTFDRSEHPAWFVGQMLVAPSGIVGFYYLDSLQAADPAGPTPDEDPAYEPSYGRTNEQGVLFTALAGMLNLLAIIDVAYRDPSDPRYAALAAEDNGGGV